MQGFGGLRLATAPALTPMAGATLGYRYTRFFSDNMLDTLLSMGHADVNEARVSFGLRF